MKNKKLIKGIIVIILAFSLLPLKSFAAETDTEVTEEISDIETEVEEPEKEAEDTEETEIAAVDNDCVMFDETSYSAKTPAQITMAFEIPKGFGLNAYGYVLNCDTGVIYYIEATDDNGYSEVCYVPYGEYVITQTGVVGDNIGEYIFTWNTERFTLSEDSSSKTINPLISGYENIEKSINEYNEEVFEEKETVEKPQVEEYIPELFFDSGFFNIKSDYNGILQYPCESNASNGAIMTCEGNACGDYDMVVKVVKQGVFGEAKCNVSLDGGVTMIGESTIDPEVELKGYGLTLKFDLDDDNAEFMVGDQFTAFTSESFNVTGCTKERSIMCLGNPIEKHEYTIKIISSGKRGVAKFSVSVDNKADKTDLIPADGIYKYGELTLYFSDGEFARDDSFQISIKPNNKVTDYKPAIIVGSILALGLIGAYIWLMSKKEKKKDYRLNTWKDLQSPEKYQ